MRQATNSTEYFWMPSPSLGENGATLGGILGFYYYPVSRALNKCLAVSALPPLAC